jgi:adenine phosphoribosyltransferase
MIVNRTLFALAKPQLANLFSRCPRKDLEPGFSCTDLEHTALEVVGMNLQPEMATLNGLKHALRQAAAKTPHQPLSDTQYSTGFQILLQDSEWATYEAFIIPQLSQLLNTHFPSRTDISVLEIGPGPQSLLSHLSSTLRRKVTTYDAFEPNGLFAAKLEEELQSTESPLPCLARPSKIRRSPFVVTEENGKSRANRDAIDQNDKYDLILFCHSMYGMKPKSWFIEKALRMLVQRPRGGMVVVFHRDGSLFQPLVCHRTASYATGNVRLADDDNVLDPFASFVAGYTLENTNEGNATRVAWRGICRSLGGLEGGHLSFSSPTVMVAFTHHATTMQELEEQMPLLKRSKPIKNRQAHVQNPASIVRPTDVSQVQQCVEWALKYESSLTVVGGSHSGHCLMSNVVAVDMSAFDKVHILTSDSLVVAEAGSTVGDIIQKTMAVDLTVPLGARPSVGAGLWLQGGIGHLARLHGLSCDNIVGAIIISVCSGEILCVGKVPSQHTPAGAVRPKEEDDILWAMRGAGTNVGIVISVTFKAHAAPTYLTRNRVISMDGQHEAERRIHEFDISVARTLSRECSVDAYLYRNADQLRLGVTTIETSTMSLAIPEGILVGSPDEYKIVNGTELFGTEMYVSGMHGGHGGGKTSSFKRCVFLKDIGCPPVAARLVASMGNAPSELCYLHLLQGGGAIKDIDSKDTAFGCRDWDFACVITGVWPREQDGTTFALSIEQWVYDVAQDLLPLSCGVYGADLGPDPRDIALAAKAFGSNLPRLLRLKDSLDPNNLLAYACPLPKTLVPKLIVLVTGESCAGKDYCADVWASALSRATSGDVSTRVVSISDETKREYAAATGTDLHRLLGDRDFKEQHRPALTAFFQDQVRRRPDLPQEHFLEVVHQAVGADVLLVTGMRDNAPVATLSHLVPESRLIEVYVQATVQTRRMRRKPHGQERDGGDRKGNEDKSEVLRITSHRPTFIFDNDTAGTEMAEAFADKFLLPFLHQDLERLADMVRSVPNFPSPGIEFRHVLGICQQPGGLALCTSLLQTHFHGDWAKVGAIACCEVGGLVNASALALRVEVPLVLIRNAGKLPPPTISVAKTPSHISSVVSDDIGEKQIEVERDAIPRAAPVVVIDDVLSTGETLCAVLKLLHEAGVSTEDISVMVLAEFPVHCGRELLHQRGFGMISVQSLLVLDGA